MGHQIVVGTVSGDSLDLPYFLGHVARGVLQRLLDGNISRNSWRATLGSPVTLMPTLDEPNVWMGPPISWRVHPSLAQGAAQTGHLESTEMDLMHCRSTRSSKAQQNVGPKQFRWQRLHAGNGRIPRVPI